MRLAAPRLAVFSLVLLLGFGIPGCGSGTGTLSGEIKLFSKPIKSGAIVVRAVDGGPILTGTIADGHYSVSNVPKGPVKISVTVSDVAPKSPPAVAGKDALSDPRKRQKASGAEPPAQPPVTVPNDLDDIDKTPLTYDTSNGFNKDFELP